jgi:hypothetical protein
MLRRLACVLIGALLLTSCSSPPTKEREQAESALTAARAAEAALYAPAALQAADAALKKYDDAVAQRDYRQALGHAIDARDLAFDAAKQAGVEKTAARSSAEKLILEVESQMKAANARLIGLSGPRPSAQAAERLRASLRTAPKALQEARAMMLRQDFRGAAAHVTPLAEAFRRDLGPPESSPGRRGRRSGVQPRSY